jgi:hypothetical protein
VIDPATGQAVEHDGGPGDAVYVPIFQHKR